MAQSPLIAVRQVSKTFPGVKALSEINIEVQAGELHAICGENGAGKSTLMKILAGVHSQFDGEYLLRGAPVRFNSTRAAEAAGVSIIHQELNLVEQLSAAANIFLGREKRGALGLRDDRAMERAAADLLDQLECKISPAEPVSALRVGDQQLIEIAKALSLEAEILIMDEPTSALTESEVERLFRIIDRLRQRGVTILYISHKMDEIFRLADRISVLRDGRLVKTLARSATSPREIAHLMVGREIEETQLGANRTPSETVLEVRNLSLPWPGHARGWRLQKINFRLRCGEIIGFAGLMGAGRTELLECLFGASPQRPLGEILLAGQPVQFRDPAEARRAGMALVTEDRKRLGLFPQMNVCGNVSLCTLDRTATAGVVSTRRERAMVSESVRQLGVKTAGIDAPITTLSGGNQQKTIIGRWLLTNPKVLLLDDPTRGIDVGAKAEIYRLMDTLCRQGLAIIVTSSELPELLTVCDRILVLCEGRLTGEFTRAEATEQKIMEAATDRE
ncbi:MAG TPA: sugar ABC transporter ATP-binding protein [Pirellulales bacterium]|jgi:ABC-type sugar transport system ATPase subunit|nr:sugar ABC transporter ATP-binding protein [Pirellulales bacterium]